MEGITGFPVLQLSASQVHQLTEPDAGTVRKRRVATEQP